MPSPYRTFFTTNVVIPLNDSENDANDDYENIPNITVDETEDKENTLLRDLEELFDEYANNELVRETYLSLKSFFTTSKCHCRDKKKKCFDIVGFRRFFERHLQFRELSREQLDNVLMGQLMAFDEMEANSKQKRPALRYRFNGHITLCKDTYLKLVGVGEAKLLAILSHLRKTGVTSRVHGNTKRIPLMLQLTMNLRRNTSALVYLPTSENYTTIFEHFQQSKKLTFDNEQKTMSRKSFVRLWKALTPHITFLKPQSDLCAVCEALRYKIAHINDPQRKEDVIAEYNDHLQVARLEREYYQENITQAQQEFSNIQEASLSLKSVD
ncbi:9472_t:CDS:2, partial [Paraglomus occultum]